MNNLNQINTLHLENHFYLKIKEGIDVHYNGELPASGMASSSAFTVGLQMLYLNFKIKKLTIKI